MAKQKFKTEVAELLHLITHSLYSQREIFLRELISNASDALDRLKYLTLTEDDYKGFPFVPRIDIEFDGSDRSTLSVSDSGIGMSAEELAQNLGTIARSGTRRFVNDVKGSVADGGAAADTNLIGQFGVGFYASFMVADRVEVTSKRAGDDQAHRWTSDGRGQFEVEPAERAQSGTTVVLHLKDDGKEFASRYRIEGIAKRYSNHIPHPIHLHYSEPAGTDQAPTDQAPTDPAPTDPEGGDAEEKVEQINAASALWKRPKSELSDGDYQEFYQTLTVDTEDPLHWVHTHAEGTLEYTTLFYLPAKAPPDIYYADYQPGVKLYVRRVFITDDDRELLPTYLRFIRGVIDSEDLPLNVSREILQQNRTMAAIRQASVKKILSELAGLAKNNPTAYDRFFTELGRVLKEGLYQDPGNREQLQELVRYRSSSEEGLVSLAQYQERMSSDQKAIYYITGDRSADLRRSPLLEAYRAKGFEVLIMADEIDELVVPAIGTYGDIELKSVNRSDTADDLKDERDEESEKKIEPLLGKMKKLLSDQVKDVRPSARLSDSPSCVVADGSDPTLAFQNVLKQLGQRDLPASKPILEVNPGHPIIVGLAERGDDALLDDASRLLLEQALLIEGVRPEDPIAFAKRLNRVMERALG
jgi:molecular chaperone HtpG